MDFDGNLLAWVEPHGSGAFVGAFVGEGAAPGMSRDFPGRAPATCVCPSLTEARKWVEEQAAAFGIPIKWVSAIRSL